MKNLIPIVTLGLLAAGCAGNPSSTPVAASTYTQPQPSTYIQPQPSAAVRDAQQRLSALGFYAGAIDGFWGPDTQAAVERFQRSRGLQVSGDLNPVTTSALQAAPLPSDTLQLTLRQPCVGMRAQAMMHMQRQHLDALLQRRIQRGMQQRSRVATAAVGDRDAGLVQCSVVSL